MTQITNVKIQVGSDGDHITVQVGDGRVESVRMVLPTGTTWEEAKKAVDTLWADYVAHKKKEGSG